MACNTVTHSPLPGYPHKVLHGDWWAGKGVGLCQLDWQGLTVNLLVSHFHAEYNRRDDVYLGHRVAQVGSGKESSEMRWVFRAASCDIVACIMSQSLTKFHVKVYKKYKKNSFVLYWPWKPPSG